MVCELCDAKADPASPLYAWNGPDRAHCNQCHADWRASSAAMHCVTCHRTFAKPGFCDEHQLLGRCSDPAGLGLVAEPNRWSTEIWRNPLSADDEGAS